MGMFDKPETPDFQQTAREQGEANSAAFQEAWRWNHPDQITPYGNERWGWDGNRWTRTYELSPEEQRQLNLTNTIENYALTTLSDSLPGILGGLQKPFTWDGQPLYGFDPNLTPQQGFNYNANSAGAPGLQSSLDFGGAPGMPTYGQADRLSAADAAYRLGERYLDPRMQEQRSNLNTELRNEGLMPGSEAYNNAMAEQGRNENQAFGDLYDRSMLAGREELTSAFDRQLAGRSQGVGEITQQGQFANDARNQWLNQMLAEFGAENNAVAQGYQAAGQSTALHNAGRQQAIQEMVTNRTVPINMLTALLSGTQVQNPQFQPFATNGSVDPAPLMQAAQLQAGANAGAYNAQSGMIGSGIGAAGTIAAAFI